MCARPLTGRTHQIRLHVAHIGHPILGDDMYGLQIDWAQRQMLHAAVLSFDHPATGKPVSITVVLLAAPLPDDFRAAMGKAGLPCPGWLQPA